MIMLAIVWHFDLDQQAENFFPSRQGGF